ncbi:hypothetical protein [Sulfitobacter aestuariivivens]|uniref:Cation/multidrug efflux pump n=1 Tax=Sulfitobacter aestuariivivens TaxID=2766981 RepID=A0A927D481_9RHOB|nr:hypothetical protein [Sulfitobacter aestuariivivens]MBD3664860.1 hypothetical protein [Sulfitobacter aestuariivivens]
MIPFVYFTVIGFGVLSVVYISLSLYSRAVRREKLEAKWEAGPKLINRDAFVKRGLEKYDSSIRRKLILGVYIGPVVVIALIIYLTNFS